jgi:DNA-binding response OmpR family regulator
MADVLLLTPSASGVASVLPALDFLPHNVVIAPLGPSSLVDATASDVVIVDARRELAAARATAHLLQSTRLRMPMLLLVTEGGLSAINADWGMRDFLLVGASPGEVEARLRLAMTVQPAVAEHFESQIIAIGDLAVDPDSYTVRIKHRHLDLTYKEFELLRYLAQHPGRVFTRAQLLQEVWGYDYYGGTRTVDVHVRRLRAKLGPEHDSMIGTVRNVGYRFNTPSQRGREEPVENLAADAESGLPEPVSPLPVPAAVSDRAGEEPAGGREAASGAEESKPAGRGG